MNYYYADLIDKINENPQWWDEHAVPRFCEFKPFAASNIYADTVVLVEIACQGCDEKFKVAFSETYMSKYMSWRRSKTADEIEKNEYDEGVAYEYSLEGILKDRGSLHYGDPPNINCCPAGPTMNSVPVRVVEWWEKEKPLNITAIFSENHGFVRRPDLEIEFDGEWSAATLDRS